MKTLSYLGTAVLLALSAFSAHAQTAITVPNFSFEAQTLAPGGNGYTGGTNSTTSITNWTTSSVGQSLGVENEIGGSKFTTASGGLNSSGTALASPADGSNAAYINDNGASSTNPATITSTNALATIAATTSYTLTVAVGNGIGQTPGDFELSLLANGVNVANTGFIDANTITSGTFQDFTVTLNAATAALYVGQNLTIQLAEAASTENTGNAQVFFDNVQLTSNSVPEPSAWAMMALGLGALVWMHRRASRSSLV